MFGVLFKLMFVCLGLFLLAFMAGQAFRNARRLDRRIAQFKAEQREMEEQGRAMHPYMALSQLYTEEEPERDRKGDKETKRRGERSRGKGKA